MAEGTLVVMSRRPRPGGTKSRLVPLLGAEGAAALAGAFLHDLLERLGDVSVARRIVAWADAGPPGAGEPGPASHPAFEFVVQVGGDLGERIAALWAAMGPPLVVVGSDAPTLPAQAVTDAFRAVAGGAAVVLQAALDGGFTLGGFAADPAPLLEGAPWGTAEVLRHVLLRARRLRAPAALLAPWYDVDAADGLQRLVHELQRDRGRAPRTAALLQRLPETRGA